MDGGAWATYIARWTELMRLFLYLLALVVGFSPAQAGGLAIAEPVAVASASQSAVSVVQDEAARAHAALIPAAAVRPETDAFPTFVSLPVVAGISSELTDRPLE